MSSRTVAVVGAIIALVTLCCAGGLTLTAGGIAQAACLDLAHPAPTSTPAAEHATVGVWQPEQVGHAATIVTVGRQMTVPPRGWIVAVATAMQESALRNLRGGPDDSLGLFQQRPSQGWGTARQLMNPTYATTQFYQHLLAVPGWQTLPLTEAAQKVQHSAYPDAYAKHESAAVAVVAAILDIPTNLLAGCAAPTGQWTQPVDGPITSGFRTPERPDHDGVDISASAGTPIRAAAAGQVITARCDTDASGQLCNRRGSPSTPGCGWYVKIRHANNLVTMYCHMVRAPIVHVGQTVSVGQQLGQVGSSGHSSGDHLHYEVHDLHEGPIDPVPYMRSMGAVLRR